ncbi:MAG TPA: CopD family protein [Gemmatimonadaceae bacterium]
MAAEPLITWSEPVQQLLSFVGSFLAAGAVGFRFTAARASYSSPAEGNFFDSALRRAAAIGLVGAVIGLSFSLIGLAPSAARAHRTIGELLTSDVTAMLSVVCPALTLVGVALAAVSVRAGWGVAALGLLSTALAPLVAGKWSGAVNPVHRLAAGLWLGTLFIMVACGLGPLLRHGELRDRRGGLAADMVNRFSPVALSMGGVVVVFGGITAWRHLPTIASLWETPYGRTLIIKLVFVATVFSLGAFNWRRQRPTLGKESAAISLRHSATLELSVAAVVLIVTSILVSLPTPKRAPPSHPPSAAPVAPVAPGS